MLGNWSLGDYFKQGSIEMSWEFLTSLDWLGIKPEMLAVTVFEGDENAPRDDESAAYLAITRYARVLVYPTSQPRIIGGQLVRRVHVVLIRRYFIG
jgi:hypothetical protein